MSPSKPSRTRAARADKSRPGASRVRASRTKDVPAVVVKASVPTDADVVVVPVGAGDRLTPAPGVELNLAYLEGRGFDGRVGQTEPMVARDGRAVLAVGIGDPATMGPDTLRRAAATAVRKIARATRIAIVVPPAGPAGEGLAQAVAEGVLLGTYAFTRYKSDAKPSLLREVVIITDDGGAPAGAARGVVVARAVRLARDLVNEPAGALTPRRLAAVAEAEGRRANLTVGILDERAAVAAGLGGLLGVAAGSEEPPRLLELLYEPKGASPSTPTVALVGKGITFDSGGLSLKTGTGMMAMKTDMSGAAAVIAAMTAIAEIGAPVRVLGLCPATENLPSGKAIKPGDVLRIRNGKTVEVLNTDAEGRLVLADALSLAVEAGVDAIVDIATLTGAVTVALGNKVAGLMSTDDNWAGEVQAAADRAGEALWRLPLPEVYRKDIDSDVADVKNIGGTGGPGTLTAGLFLREFTGGVPWAHLDIAGTARSDTEDGYIGKGGTGWGVRTLVELVTSGAVATHDGATRRARWSGRTPVAQLNAPAKKR